MGHSLIDFWEIAHVVPALSVVALFLQKLRENVIDRNDLIGKLSFLILNNSENLRVDPFVELPALLRAEVLPLHPPSHREQSGQLEQVVSPLMGEIVLDEDGLVVPGEFLIFVYFLFELMGFEELGLLCGLEGLGVQGSDVLDL